MVATNLPKVSSPLQAAVQASNITPAPATSVPTTPTLGSGKLYKTTVERQTEGELTGWQSSMCILNL